MRPAAPVSKIFFMGLLVIFHSCRSLNYDSNDWVMDYDFVEREKARATNIA